MNKVDTSPPPAAERLEAEHGLEAQHGSARIGLLSREAVQAIFFKHGEPIAAYDALLTASGLPAGGGLVAPSFLLTVLAAFEDAYRDLLGVDYLYVVRSVDDDPIARLRDSAKALTVGGVESWPSDEELRWALLLLLVAGFVYDFPLAKRYCHGPGDVHKRQTRIAGWGIAYFSERMANETPFKELFEFAGRRFREQLVPVASHVTREARMIERPRLNDTVEWVAP
jgi:hypothetical protein